MLHVGEEIYAVLFFVGEDDVKFAVSIKINEACAIGINFPTGPHRRTRRQSEWPFAPTFLLVGPSVNFWFLNDLRSAIAINVNQSRTLIISRMGKRSV